MTRTRKGVDSPDRFVKRLKRFIDLVESDNLSSRGERRAAEPKRPKRPGRRRGDGEYNDAPYLEKMLPLMQQRQCKSIKEAASKFADDVKGSSQTARIERLRKKFSKAYPNWRDERLSPFRAI